MELPGWFPKSSQLAFGRPVVVAFCVVVGLAVVVVAVVVGLAGAVTWLVAAPAAPPRIPGAASAEAVTRESAHAAAIVVMDLRTFIRISFALDRVHG
jgi:flagellar basal body-associated protein FliL